MADSYFDPSMLKLKSVTDSIGSSNPPPSPQPQEDVNPDNELTALMGKLYQPGHEVADKFNEVWSQQPQHEKAGILRKVVASMVGAGGGPKAADAVLNDPYNEARAEWMDKLKMLQPALSEERNSNTNERMIASNAANNTIAQRRINETNRHNQAAEELNSQKLEVTKDRAATYKYKAENPDHKFMEDSNGDLMALDPKSGKETPVLNEDGVPVKSLKNLSAAEKERLDIKSRADIESSRESAAMARTKEAGAQARETEGVKQKGRVEIKQNKDASGKVISTTTTVYDKDGNVTGSKTVNASTEPVKPDKTGDVKVPSNVPKVRMVTPPDAQGKTREIMVPEDKVSEATARGAKRK